MKPRQPTRLRHPHACLADDYRRMLRNVSRVDMALPVGTCPRNHRVLPSVFQRTPWQVRLVTHGATAPTIPVCTVPFRREAPPGSHHVIGDIDAAIDTLKVEDPCAPVNAWRSPQPSEASGCRSRRLTSSPWWKLKCRIVRLRMSQKTKRVAKRQNESSLFPSEEIVPDVGDVPRVAAIERWQAPKSWTWTTVGEVAEVKAGLPRTPQNRPGLSPTKYL